MCRCILRNKPYREPSEDREGEGVFCSIGILFMIALVLLFHVLLTGNTLSLWGIEIGCKTLIGLIILLFFAGISWVEFKDKD